MKSTFMISTTNNIEGCPIKKYIDVICSNIVIGTNIFSDFAEEIQKNITDMAFKADEMDNYLADTFGCEFSEYAKKDAI